MEGDGDAAERKKKDAFSHRKGVLALKTSYIAPPLNDVRKGTPR